MTSIDELRQEFRTAYLDILLPVRMTRDKVIPAEDGRRLIALADRFVGELAGQESVPKDLVGELYFPFLQLLSEAEHANDPDPVLNFAWKYQARLEKIFPHP